LPAPSRGQWSAMGLDHVRSEIEHMRVQLGRQRKEISSFSAPAYRPHRLSFYWSGCWRRSRAFVKSATASRQSRAVPRKGACLAAGVGDARTTEMVRRQGGQLALDRRACRTTSTRHARGTLPSTRPSGTVAIDQYAEKALGNRDYFLNKPYGVG
jgi:hypothetical protein